MSLVKKVMHMFISLAPAVIITRTVLKALFTANRYHGVLIHSIASPCNGHMSFSCSIKKKKKYLSITQETNTTFQRIEKRCEKETIACEVTVHH